MHMQISSRKLLALALILIFISSVITWQLVVLAVTPKPSPNLVFDDYPSMHNVVVKTDGSGNFWATWQNGSIVDWGTNLSAIETDMAGNLSSNGGSIFLQQVQWNTSISLANNVIVFQDFNGTYQSFNNQGSFVLTNLNGDPSTSGWGQERQGFIWYNIVADVYKYWNGSAIVIFPSIGGGSSSSYVLPVTYTIYASGSTYTMEKYDGTTWSSTNASDVINTANAACDGKGGLIHIRSGDYYVTSTLEMGDSSFDPHPMIWEGEGSGTIIHTAAALDYTLETRRADSKKVNTKLVLRNMQFDGHNDTYPTEGSGMRFCCFSGILQFLTVKNYQYDGIQWYGFDDNNSAVNGVIEDCYISHNGGAGVDLANASSTGTTTGSSYAGDISVSRCSIFQNGGDGVYVNIGDARVSDCNIYGNQHGVRVYQSVVEMISNNHFEGNYQDQIKLASSGFHTLYVNIFGNNFYGSAKSVCVADIVLTGTASAPIGQVNIHANNFKNDSDLGYAWPYAIKFVSYVDNFTVVGNTFNNYFIGNAMYIGNNITNGAFDDNPGYCTSASGKALSCVDGTWIALPPDFAGTPTMITLTLRGDSSINSTTIYLQPTVNQANSSMFQIYFEEAYVRNYLLNIVPTSTTWGTTPSDLQNCTDGVWSQATGTGQTNTSSATTWGEIHINMTTMHTLMLTAKIAVWQNASATEDAYFIFSTDGVTWTAVNGMSGQTNFQNSGATTSSSGLGFMGATFASTQWVGIRFKTESTANLTNNAIIYEIQGYDPIAQNTVSVGTADASPIYWTATYDPLA